MHFRAALAAAERTLDPGDGTVGAYLNNVGKALTEQGRYAEAWPYFERAIPIAEAAYGPESPVYARVLSNAADALSGLGETERAADMYRQALSVLEADPGSDHPWTRHARDRLAALTEAAD